jgi:5-methylcytosine-specific restriction endonuclease McrA
VDQRKEAARLADRLIHQSRWNINPDTGKFRDSSFPPADETKQFRGYVLEKYAPGKWTKGRTTGWDADHIVPVVEGGGECDLSNYRTLCHPCHKAVTAELAARRAEARRAEPPVISLRRTSASAMANQRLQLNNTRPEPFAACGGWGAWSSV